MKRVYLTALVIILASATLFITNDNFFEPTNESPKEYKLPRLERKKHRAEYFFKKLKDPKTNEIPANVRLKELQYSRALKSKSAGARTASNISHTWSEVGPSNVGGRTRALALDSRNSSIVLAGGVSGGIWKSTDGGTTWQSKLAEGSHLSISSIAQDPIAPNTWYASTGEIADGGSASGRGSGNSYYLGTGIYKSTDNGDNWALMTYSDDDGDLVYEKQANPDERITSFMVHPFQLTSKVLVNDFEGISTIFVTTQYSGIWASSDGGETFSKFGSSLTSGEDPVYCDIVIDKNDIITVWFGPTASSVNGFYRSYDGGNNFSDVTPNNYPSVADGARAVNAFSPSNPEILYSFLHDGSSADYLFKFDYTNIDGGGSSISSSDRSANLPEFSESIFGGPEEFTTQGGYDMAIAVHPTDPDFVVLGYVNLVKSEDGFATPITNDPAKYWIGGNDNPWLLDESYSFEEQGVHHADQHVLFFDPNNPNTLFSGHDGGLSKTTDIKANRVTWTSLNNDYNVTQFYTVSAGLGNGDSYIIGGTQDNGTPLIDHSSFAGSLLPRIGDISSGDGSFCYAGDEIIYSSAQNGALSVYTTANGYFYRFFSRDDLNTLFIHPFAVDPNDEGTLFFSTFGDGILARNTSFDEGVLNDDISVIENGWDDLNYGDAVGVSAIRVSDQNPSHKLYFGGTLNDEPVLFSWENANTSSDVNAMNFYNLSDVEMGAWLSDIAINPENGNELLLVYSNYNIIGLYHSSDGGATLTAVEGNLNVDDDQAAAGFSGPSLRAAEIVVDNAGNKKYVVATSIGVYSTSTLDGMNTSWTLETELLDNVVVEDLDYRKEDGALVAGTHGRGIFFGSLAGSNINTAPVVANQTFQVKENAAVGTVIGTVTATDANGDVLAFSISGGNTGNVFALNSASGELSLNGLIDEQTTSYQLQVEVTDGELTSSASISIEVKEPNSAPEIANQSFSIDEDFEVGEFIGTVEASDPDDDGLTFTVLEGNENEIFYLDESTGELWLDDVLDFEEQSEYNLLVEVSDGVVSTEASVVISVNKVLALTPEAFVKVYPNPVIGDKLSIKLAERQETEVFLNDMLGKKVFYTKGLKDQWQINTSKFNEGHYVLTIRTAGATVTKKLMISNR